MSCAESARWRAAACVLDTIWLALDSGQDTVQERRCRFTHSLCSTCSEPFALPMHVHKFTYKCRSHCSTCYCCYVCTLPPAACWLLPTACCLLLPVACPSGCCLPVTADCWLLPAACCLLGAACCLLPVTVSSLSLPPPLLPRICSSCFVWKSYSFSLASCHTSLNK